MRAAGKCLFRTVGGKDLGAQFTGNNKNMAGQDGAYSIPLYNGSSLWFFGDTLIGSRRPEESIWYLGMPGEVDCGISENDSIDKIVTNTALILPDQKVSGGLRGFEYICGSDKEISQLIPYLADEDPEEIRIWCLDGCRIGKMIYLFYLKIQLIPGKPVPTNFRICGTGIAAASSPHSVFRRLKCNKSEVYWDGGLPDFGTAVLYKPEAEYVYLYGVRNEPEDGQTCYLARVKPDRIGELPAYEYYAGEEALPSSSNTIWSEDTEAAVPVFTGVPNEMSVSYNRYLGCYLAVHSMNLTGEIVGRTSANPWGPWSAPGVLWKTKLAFGNTPGFKPVVYAGKEHPELSDGSGRIIYVTYIEFEEYFPRLVEIHLAKYGGDAE